MDEDDLNLSYGEGYDAGQDDMRDKYEEALSALLKADARIKELEEKLGKAEAKVAAFESNSRPG